MTDFSPRLARNLAKLPPYLFARIDALKAEAKAKGADLIDVSIGDPDQPTFKHIVKEGKAAAAVLENHQYPSYAGKPSFRAAVAQWYQARFGVALEPATEVLTLIGSKEGIGHIPFAFLDPGDVVLVPDPGYPVYNAATILAGGEPHMLPLTKKNDFLPDLDAVPPEVTRRAKLLFLNYPNNPTAAVADLAFYRKVVDFAQRTGVIVCHDAAYSEMYYDGAKPPSFLEVEGAKEVGIEFHSLSKTYNMTGWRVGFAVGNASVIKGLGHIKANVDSGAFGAVQDAGIAALTGDQRPVEKMRRLYQKRRNVLYRGLRRLGLKLKKPQASFYVWCEVPAGRTSESFSSLLLEKAAVVCTPGNGFGAHGEGYVRFALTVDAARLEEAVERIGKVL
ncbi:MAG TPA: LL-diaminopimelate aminotransferase [Candidatus Methanoperedens sp.]|nr:LL-diaminopimelate aminotransferase [Candidatus Methanoperedens sp.]